MVASLNLSENTDKMNETIFTHFETELNFHRQSLSMVLKQMYMCWCFSFFTLSGCTVFHSDAVVYDYIAMVM